MGEEDNFDDIDKALEEHEDRESQISEAYRQWEEEGDRSMLENLTYQMGMQHAYDVKDKINKNGEKLHYDKNDAGKAGLIFSAAPIIIHPLLISLWIFVLAKIVKDSIKKMKGKSGKWEKINAFGFETFYYVTYSAVVAYILISLKGKEMLLADFPTTLRMIVEFSNMVIGLA